MIAQFPQLDEVTESSHFKLEPYTCLEKCNKIKTVRKYRIDRNKANQINSNIKRVEAKQLPGIYNNRDSAGSEQ